MEPYAPVGGADPFAASVMLVTALVAELESPGAAGLTAYELEQFIAGLGREVQRQMVQDHLDLRAAREEETAREHGTAVAGADGITRNRVETGHRRLLSTLFGTVQVTRCAWRRPGAGNLYPADAALSLPAPRHSHTLARLAALEAVRGSSGTAHAAITGRCGPVMGKRQIEQAVVNAAGDIAAFYAARVPMPCTAATLLVISADAKGVVMRPGALRPATAKAAARRGRMRTRLAAGEKPNRKRMATLACVYDAGPAPRRPHDVIAPPGGRHGHRKLRPRPKAKAKWLAGSVEHDPAEVIAAASGQAEARDPARQRTWVILAGGAGHQLGLIRAEAARRGITISILIDLIHVLELSSTWIIPVHLEGRMVPAHRRGPRSRRLGSGQSARGTGRRQRPGSRRHHRRSGRRRPDRRPAQRRGHLRPLPDGQAGAPALRPGPGRGLAHRDRGNRRSLPPPTC